MQQNLFDELIDEKVKGDRIKILLKKIHSSLKAIEEAWICRARSHSLDYISQIKILFSIYGIKMFQQDVESTDVLTGCFLYSQPINAKKIQCPRNFNNEQKDAFKKSVDDLVKAWTFMGKHFSYEKLAATAVNNEPDRQELEKKLKERITF